MEKYCNRKQYTLRYSDFDFKDELSLFALLCLVQESAGASADELGFGYDALKKIGCGFVVVNTYCEFFRPIKLGEQISVETWPLPPRHVIFERDSRALAESGEVVANFAARWCLVDLKSFSLLTPEKLGKVHEDCPYRDEKTTTPPAWKIPRAENGTRIVRTVRVSDCDHYLHANNAKYADFFMDCFTMEELKARRIKAFQIAYIKQAKEGTELELFREDSEGGSICEARACGELIAQFRVWFAEEGA